MLKIWEQNLTYAQFLPDNLRNKVIVMGPLIGTMRGITHRASKSEPRRAGGSQGVWSPPVLVQDTWETAGESLDRLNDISGEGEKNSKAEVELCVLKYRV